ncbi:MAG: MarR family transcriptional regulator [Thomasclavelia sp.]|nr:MarR family transcriptional regulator [Thomasclavelia sp.]
MTIAGKIAYISNQNNKYINSKLKGKGVTYSEAKIIRVVYNNPGCTQDFLVKQMVVDKAVVARSLKSMQDKGFVKRIMHEDDKRKKIIKLTKKGYDIQPSIEYLFKQANKRLIATMNVDTKKDLNRLLNTLLSNSKTETQEL